MASLPTESTSGGDARGSGEMSGAKTQRRGPLVASLVVAAILLGMALFARGGIHRAAAVLALAPGGQHAPMIRDLDAMAVIIAIVACMASSVTVIFGVRLMRSLRHEDMLRARLHDEQRLAALGQMSAVLAHELRNPLASLKGNAQLLVEVLPEADGRRAKAERVVGAAVRLQRLTDELLEFVRTGELRIRRTPVEDVVRAAVQAIGDDRLQVQIAPDLGAAAIDEERLRRALENVLRNALDGAAPDEPVVVDAHRQGHAVSITVRDHGPGIVAGDEEHIFQPFFTRKNHGTGLGLAVTRRIVELHGGRIVAFNHEDGGAVVVMTLPGGG